MATCERCKSVFPCVPEGRCWCMETPRGLPIPNVDHAGCLCPNCLETVREEYAETIKNRMIYNSE